MINRVLIRIKVVQMLYSYLISDNSFSIEHPAENQTREKRFAYQAYLDMLAMMVAVSDKIKQRGGYTPLAHTRFIETISTEERVAAIVKGRVPSDLPLDSIANQVAESIKESLIYRNYIKEEQADHRIWSELFKYYISENASIVKVFIGRENYTLHGLERARQMVETTFANFYASSDDVKGAIRNLERSLQASRELYLRLLSLPSDMTHQRRMDIDENRLKYIRTSEDENPNMRFVDNKLIEAIDHDEKLQAEREANPALNWLSEDRQLIKSLLKAVMESETYKSYMAKETPSTLEEDSDLWRELFKKVVFPNEDLLSTLEDKSVFWNDDIEIIGEFLLKTLKRYAKEPAKGLKVAESQLMPMYKDEEDRKFGRELMTAALRNRPTYRKWISEAVNDKRWDAERLALMDVVILVTAIAEIMNFPNIPLQVSINEYINMAKAYSTPKSGSFVNGILASVVGRLKEEGKLMK